MRNRHGEEKSIKAFYYEVYKKNGLKKLEPWN